MSLYILNFRMKFMTKVAVKQKYSIPRMGKVLNKIRMAPGPAVTRSGFGEKSSNRPDLNHEIRILPNEDLCQK